MIGTQEVTKEAKKKKKILSEAEVETGRDLEGLFCWF